jgi:CheY-like chemotaxis protein
MSDSRTPDGALPQDILIVEDNIIIAMDVEESLRQIGVRDVRVAHNVENALSAIGQRLPDCALLDIELAHGTSFAVAALLQQHGIRFAFMSGYDDNATRGTRFRGVTHLRKPFTIQELTSFLR